MEVSQGESLLPAVDYHGLAAAIRRRETIQLYVTWAVDKSIDVIVFVRQPLEKLEPKPHVTRALL
jgi:hypothetical protein